MVEEVVDRVRKALENASVDVSSLVRKLDQDEKDARKNFRYDFLKDPNYKDYKPNFRPLSVPESNSPEDEAPSDEEFKPELDGAAASQPKAKRDTISITLDGQLWKQFKQAAVGNNKKYSHLLEDIIRDFLKNARY